MSTELRMDLADMHNKIGAGRITPGEIECLRRAVNYLYHDEEKDFLQHDPKDRENHIFKSVFILEGVVNRQAQSEEA